MITSDIKIRKIFPEGTLKAVASITINNAIAIHDIKVIESNGRIFVAMPNRKDENGIFRDIAHPIDSETRIELEKEILGAYEKQLALDNLNT